MTDAERAREIAERYAYVPERTWNARDKCAEAIEAALGAVRSEATAAAEQRIAGLEAESERDEACVAWDEWRTRALSAEARLARAREALKRIGRGAKLQARVMRDPRRTSGWAGAEKVANAFDDIADRALADSEPAAKPQP